MNFMQRPIPWTAERVDELCRLWRANHSASQIAAILGGVTRNGVIGKVHRLGLGAGGQSQRPAPTPRRAAAPAVRTPVAKHVPARKVAPAAPIVKIVDAAIPIEQRRSLVQLDERCCHWPVGNPGEPDFFFCGGIVNEGEPYCPAHMRRAHTPPSDRRLTSKKANRDGRR